MQNDIGRSGMVATDSLWHEQEAETSPETPATDRVAVELTAAVIGLSDEQPVVLVRPEQGADQASKAAAGDVKRGAERVSLPSLAYRPAAHGVLDAAIRARVVALAGIDLGYVEQLSTDCDFTADRKPGPAHLSIGYLALMRVDGRSQTRQTRWTSCYDLFPWEDWRQGRPEILSTDILPRLSDWADAESDADRSSHALSRRDRLCMAFGLEGGKWDDERVADRLDLLAEAGLADVVSPRMQHDHQRILATAIGRLRAKIRSRPLVFELLPVEFTLFELQKTVEAILGPHLHKQNFRRLVEGTGLVEPTGEVRTHTGGRPAKLFRFRREVLLERPAPGVRVKAGRAA